MSNFTPSVVSHTVIGIGPGLPVSVPALIRPNTDVPASVHTWKLTPWHPTPSQCPGIK